MSTITSTRILTDMRALLDIRSDWEKLWSADPKATVFQHPAWLLAWWRSFHPGALRVFAVRSEAALIALAPLYLETTGAAPRLMPIGVSLSDYTDVLLHPVDPRAGLSAIADAISCTGGEWRYADWDDVAPSANVRELKADLRIDVREEETIACPVLPLPDASRTLADVVPARKLRKSRMARHRVERRDHELVRHAEIGQAFVQTLEQLHTMRWNSRGETGVFADNLLADFLLDALPGMMAAGLVNATTLTIEGRAAAAYLGFQHRDMACAYMGGFDPQFAFESPGTVLIEDALQQAMEAGAHEFHFLRGAESYKYEWGASDRMNRRLSVTVSGRADA